MHCLVSNCYQYIPLFCHSCDYFWLFSNRSTITESCLLRSRRLWAPSPMTLCPTSPPASLTCCCTPTWPCGAVCLKDPSCLITPAQSGSQKHRTRISGLKHKVTLTVNQRPPPHHHRTPHTVAPPHRSPTLQMLNQPPQHRWLRQYRRARPHRLPTRVWFPLNQGHTSVQMSTIKQNQGEKGAEGAWPLSEDRACSAWEPQRDSRFFL